MSRRSCVELWLTWGSKETRSPQSFISVNSDLRVLLYRLVPIEHTQPLLGTAPSFAKAWPREAEGLTMAGFLANQRPEGRKHRAEVVGCWLLAAGSWLRLLFAGPTT